MKNCLLLFRGRAGTRGICRIQVQNWYLYFQAPVIRYQRQTIRYQAKIYQVQNWYLNFQGPVFRYQNQYLNFQGPVFQVPAPAYQVSAEIYQVQNWYLNLQAPIYQVTEQYLKIYLYFSGRYWKKQVSHMMLKRRFILFQWYNKVWYGLIVVDKSPKRYLDA